MKPGRNDPCPCGSGKKFKKCCADKLEARLHARNIPAKGVTPTTAEINQLVALFNAGHHEELENKARLLIRKYPASGFLWRALGASLHAQGKEAIPALHKAAALLPDDADMHGYLGAVLQDLGQLESAVSSYRHALKLKPDFAEMHNNLGNALRDLGQLENAVVSFHRALEFKPDLAGVHSNLGNALRDLGQLDDAVASYRRALKLKPDFAEVHGNLGNVLRDLGQLEDAVASCRQALELRPDFAEVHGNLGNALRNLGQLDDAVASYRRALEIKPDFAEVYGNLGTALRELGQLDDAVESYHRALEIKPDYAEAYRHLGATQQDRGQFNEAVASFHRALEIKPDYAEVYLNLGNALQELGRPDEAVASFLRALEVKPDYAEARWMLAMAEIPSIADTHEEIAACRAKFTGELAELDAWFNPERTALGYKAVGTCQPFYLAYQEENNREILFQYGTLCTRLMKHWQSMQAFPSPVIAPGGAIRVGIVSAHLHKHSVWDAIVKGWFQLLDRERIELHVFHLGSKQDDETHWAKSRSASFEQGTRGLKPWVEAILEKQTDVLIYPEIGMNPMTVKLASLRLAQVQIASWGHPETSGLPTIDHYLSAKYLEPMDAQDNYTENLICLPNLGCHYHPEQVTSMPPDLANLGIDNTVPILICPGTPFKYAPQHDHVLVEIAQKLGKCQFVFFTYHLSGLSEKLRQRLEIAFAKSNMNFNDYGRFIPWQEQSAFYGLLKRADVFLDTIGFSGFNTAMQAVECGLPIVTGEGRFMRGRLASGILRRMDMAELIADTEETYVNLAV